MMTFSTVIPCPASLTRWVEAADELDDLSFIPTMTAAELFAHPLVRQLSAEGAAEAERVELDEQRAKA
jgi:hypothetical protein